MNDIAIVNRPTRSLAAIASTLTLLAFALPAWSQGDPMLKPADVTADDLIRRLSPDPTMRSIRIRPNQPPGGPASVESSAAITPAKKPAVALQIIFETNSAELTPTARKTLDVVGDALNSNELSEFAFAIEGHADPRGGTDLNLRLSQARAEAVRTYLVAQHRVDTKRLSAQGKGDRELMNKQNPTAPENRRVMIINQVN
jgi:outer membrane protein OmpA-like peptidoglycan-associated protein